MRLLVTGKQGQLSRALQKRTALNPGVQLLVVGRPEVDLETPGSLSEAIRAARPDLVINAAAYTAVDQAEEQPQRAFRLNADAAGEAAEATTAIGAPIIHLSTDYVFEGAAGGAYREDAPTNPLGVYGRSKLAGEEQVRTANDRHLIIRTSWVYSPWGQNFVKTMLRLAQDRDEVSVVADQYGCPTSAIDLADALLHIVEAHAGRRVSLEGTYHVAGAGACSWADLAEEVYRLSNEFRGPTATVKRIASSEFRAAAPRPQNSVLDCSKFEHHFGYTMRPWRRALADVVQLLLVEPPFCDT